MEPEGFLRNALKAISDLTIGSRFLSTERVLTDEDLNKLDINLGNFQAQLWALRSAMVEQDAWTKLYFRSILKKIILVAIRDPQNDPNKKIQLARLYQAAATNKYPFNVSDELLKRFAPVSPGTAVIAFRHEKMREVLQPNREYCDRFSKSIGGGLEGIKEAVYGLSRKGKAALPVLSSFFVILMLRHLELIRARAKDGNIPPETFMVYVVGILEGLTVREMLEENPSNSMLRAVFHTILCGVFVISLHYIFGTSLLIGDPPVTFVPWDEPGYYSAVGAGFFLPKAMPLITRFLTGEDFANMGYNYGFVEIVAAGILQRDTVLFDKIAPSKDDLTWMLISAGVLASTIIGTFGPGLLVNKVAGALVRWKNLDVGEEAPAVRVRASRVPIGPDGVINEDAMVMEAVAGDRARAAVVQDRLNRVQQAEEGELTPYNSAKKMIASVRPSFYKASQAIILAWLLNEFRENLPVSTPPDAPLFSSISASAPATVPTTTPPDTSQSIQGSYFDSLADPVCVLGVFLDDLEYNIAKSSDADVSRLLSDKPSRLSMQIVRGISAVRKFDLGEFKKYKNIAVGSIVAEVKGPGCEAFRKKLCSLRTVHLLMGVSSSGSDFTELVEKIVRASIERSDALGKLEDDLDKMLEPLAELCEGERTLAAGNWLIPSTIFLLLVLEVVLWMLPESSRPMEMDYIKPIMLREMNAWAKEQIAKLNIYSESKPQSSIEEERSRVISYFVANFYNQSGTIVDPGCYLKRLQFKLPGTVENYRSVLAVGSSKLSNSFFISSSNLRCDSKVLDTNAEKNQLMQENLIDFQLAIRNSSISSVPRSIWEFNRVFSIGFEKLWVPFVDDPALGLSTNQGRMLLPVIKAEKPKPPPEPVTYTRWAGDTMANVAVCIDNKYVCILANAKIENTPLPMLLRWVEGAAKQYPLLSYVTQGIFMFSLYPLLTWLRAKCLELMQEKDLPTGLWLSLLRSVRYLDFWTRDNQQTPSSLEVENVKRDNKMWWRETRAFGRYLFWTSVLPFGHPGVWMSEVSPSMYDSSTIAIYFAQLSLVVHVVRNLMEGRDYVHKRKPPEKKETSSPAPPAPVESKPSLTQQAKIAKIRKIVRF